MVPLASIVDWDAVVEVLWTATVAGLGVTTIFAVAIVGATKAADASREGRAFQTVVYGLVGLVALAAVAAAVAFGIVVMVTK